MNASYIYFEHIIEKSTLKIIIIIIENAFSILFLLMSSGYAYIL